MRMPRQRKPARALGPYEDGPRLFRVVAVAADGSRESEWFDSQKKAEVYKAFLEEQLVATEITTATALNEFLAYKEAQGRKDGTAYQYRRAVDRFFPTPLPVWALTEKRCQVLYDEMAQKFAVDTHRNTLANVKTFLRWCVARGYCKENPAEKIEGTGKRKRGKEQLRRKELRAWFAKAKELGEEGHHGAVASLMALVLGMRASEIVSRTVRDCDEEMLPCDTLIIERGKTDKATRTLEVPEFLRGMLVMVAGARDIGPLFPAKGGGFHERGWVIDNVKRICRLAGVANVTAHGMRGTLADMALRQGFGDIVPFLGHESIATTEGYAKPGAKDEGQRKRGMRALGIVPVESGEDE